MTRRVTVLSTCQCCWAKVLKAEERSTKKTGGRLAANRWPAHIPLRFWGFTAQLRTDWTVLSPTQEPMWKKRHTQGLSDFKRLKFYSNLHFPVSYPFTQGGEWMRIGGAEGLDSNSIDTWRLLWNPHLPLFSSVLKLRVYISTLNFPQIFLLTYYSFIH